MADLNTIKTDVSRPISLWGRIALLLLSIAFSFVFTIFLAFALFPPQFLIFLIFFTTLALGFTLSFLHSRYLSLSNLSYFILATLTIWALVCLIFSPLFIKLYYLKTAEKILPSYASLERKSVVFTRANMTSAATVRSSYISSKPEADYQKMNIVYKNILSQNGYRVDEEEIGSYVIFQKNVSPLPRIFVGISKQQPKEINVTIHF